MAAAAYRAGVALTDERTGEVHDYRPRSGVVGSRVIVPGGGTVDRASLWNGAERAEKRVDARTGREWEIALPAELSPGDRMRLAGQFGRYLSDRYGVAVDLAIHEPSARGDQRNHHAHLLMTTRTVTVGADGAPVLGGKSQAEWDNKQRKQRGLPTSQDDIREVRAAWAGLANAALERAGKEARIDHRSLADQGIEDRAPGVKIGMAGKSIERRGEVSIRAAANREVAYLSARLAQAKQTEAGERARWQSASDAELARVAEEGLKPVGWHWQRLAPVRESWDRYRRTENDAARAAAAADASGPRIAAADRRYELATEAAGGWRQRRRVRAWLHDAGWWRSPELTGLDQQQRQAAQLAERERQAAEHARKAAEAAAASAAAERQWEAVKADPSLIERAERQHAAAQSARAFALNEIERRTADRAAEPEVEQSARPRSRGMDFGR